MATMDRHAKAALRRELQRAEDERDRLDVVISYLRERLDEAEEPLTPAGTENGAVSARRATSGGKAPGISSADAAEQVLRTRGERMKTQDLLLAVRALGATMKNAEGMYKTLKRSSKFRREGRGLWALAEWPEQDRQEALIG